MGGSNKRKKDFKKDLSSWGIETRGKNISELEALHAEEKRRRGLTKSGKIPANASENGLAEKMEKNQGLFLSFADYQKSLCELKDFNETDLEELIFELQEASNDKNKKYKSVENDNGYQKLYEKIPKLSKVYEFILKDNKRVFFYKIDNVLYIICIKHKHFSTDDKG